MHAFEEPRPFPAHSTSAIVGLERFARRKTAYQGSRMPPKRKIKSDEFIDDSDDPDNAKVSIKRIYLHIINLRQVGIY